MALPSDPAESFVREVDENLRRDQLRDAAKSYGKWIIVLLILLLAAVGGYLYWQDRQQKQAVEQGEALSAALDKAGSGNAKAAQAELAPLAESSNDVVHASAELARAALALRQNDRKTAIEIYRRDRKSPWVHLDIAGTAYTQADLGTVPRGPTGVPVGIFVEFVRGRES